MSCGKCDFCIDGQNCSGGVGGDDESKKMLAHAITDLLLADHMGDAHDAGVRLAKFMWGKEGVNEYMQSVSDGHATPRLRALLREHLPDIWRIDDEDKYD